MRINKKDFLNLKQNDRIEFLLRHKEINEDHGRMKTDWVGFFVFIGLLGLIVGLYFLGVANLTSIEEAVPIFQTLPVILKIGVFGAILMFIFNVGVTLLEIKRLRELEEEFFDFKIEPKDKRSVKKVNKKPQKKK